MAARHSTNLLIFDCDGVLVDSEMIGCRVEASFLTDIGIPISVNEIMERYVGISETAMFADLEARCGGNCPLVLVISFVSALPRLSRRSSARCPERR